MGGELLRPIKSVVSPFRPNLRLVEDHKYVLICWIIKENIPNSLKCVVLIASFMALSELTTNYVNVILMWYCQVTIITFHIFFSYMEIIFSIIIGNMGKQISKFIGNWIPGLFYWYFRPKLSWDEGFPTLPLCMSVVLPVIPPNVYRSLSVKKNRLSKQNFIPI